MQNSATQKPLRASAASSPPSRDSGLRIGYLILAALNTCGTSYYLYYLFFYLQKHFGFGNLGNLTFSALNGFVYMFAAWYGGKIAQKHGYYEALTFGFCTMIVCLLCGSQWGALVGQFVVMMVWTVGMCFTWPSLEALISESVEPRSLPRMIGVYNVVWSGFGALTYFCGGAVFERFGEKSLFLVPAAIHGAQLIILGWLRVRRARPRTIPVQLRSSEPPLRNDPARPSEKIARSFLRMAWFSNPFAYIALNTVIAVVPEIARKLHLSPTMAGFFCSIWFFARMGTFILLWQWTAWHYRFSWLLLAFMGLVASFAMMLLVPSLWVLFGAQILLGLSVGLIYYSSLFYSMDVGESKGEHGGVHEAAIGLGIFLGPAVGAAALRFLPQFANSGAWAVSGLLMLGLGMLIVAKRKQTK